MIKTPIHNEPSVGGFTIKVFYDPECESPRKSCDNLAVFAADQPPDALTDKWATRIWGEDRIHSFNAKLLSERGAEAAEKNLRRAWAVGHYEIVVSLGGNLRTVFVLQNETLFGVSFERFTDGQAFFAFVPGSRIDAEWPGLTNKEKEEKASEVVAAEVSLFRQWCVGECFGFRVTAPDGAEVDSCWGFIGFEDCLESAKEAALCAAQSHCPTNYVNVCCGI